MHHHWLQRQSVHIKLASSFGGLFHLVCDLVCGESCLICVVSDCDSLIDMFLGHKNAYVMTGVN